MAKLTQCPNGHFYDMERSPQCPYCGQSEAQRPMMPPDCPGEEEFRVRLAEQEAVRAGDVTGEIPQVDGADAGKTVSLREEAMDKTVPLQEEAMNKTQPLDGAGIDKTQPLSGRAPQPAADLGRLRKNLRQMCYWTAFALVISLGLVIFNVIEEAIAMTGGCAAVLVCCVLCLRTQGARPPFMVSVLATLFSVIAGLGGTEWAWWDIQTGRTWWLLRGLLRFTNWYLYAALGAVSCILIPPITLIAIYRYQKAAKVSQL